MEKNSTKPAWVCIDFGTCNTAAAIEVEGKPHIVTHAGQPFFPTVACVLPEGSIEVCQEAEPLRTQMPEGFRQEFKLHIHEPLGLHGREYTDLVGEILRYVKGFAEIENGGQPLNNVILTFPALYTESDVRIDVMRKAAERAGFEEVEFLPEPEAAALHYAQIIDRKRTGLSLIYDLGGGTFDPALLDLSHTDAPQLLGEESGVKCGGQFFDKAIYQHLSKQAAEAGKPLVRGKRLEDYAACRRLKEALSVKDSATQYFSNGQQATLSRATFNELIRSLVLLTFDACDNLLHTAGKQWKEVKQVLLVGGSTSIPLISEMLQSHLASHNATGVTLVRNTAGPKGTYNHLHATSLGGIAKKILPPPPPPQPIARLSVKGQTLQLKQGLNTFGRNPENDFRFDNDCRMSRHHFEITVTKGADGRWNYVITTVSQSKPTIINGFRVLCIETYPITERSCTLANGDRILAGATEFTFVK